MRALAIVGCIAVLAVFAPKPAWPHVFQGEPDSPASAQTCQGDCVPRSRLVASEKKSSLRLKGWRRAEKRAWDLHRTLVHRPDVVEAIALASVVYGVSRSRMLSRASCESTGGHGLDPRAANPQSSARGLFEFLTRGRVRQYGTHRSVNGGTWATTPFYAFDVFSPYANAFAAGWMMGPAHRSGEWVCR